MNLFCQRALMLALVVGAAALALSACASRPQPVTFDNAAYQFTGRQGEASLYSNEAGQTLRVEPYGDGTQVTVGSQVYLVTGTASDVSVTFPDGRTLEGSYTGGAMAGLAPLGANVTSEDWNRLDDLRAIAFSKAANPPRSLNWGQVLLGLVTAAAGVLGLLNPRLARQISKGWRYQNVEPSESDLGLSRAGGVVMILIALFLIIGAGW